MLDTVMWCVVGLWALFVAAIVILKLIWWRDGR